MDPSSSFDIRRRPAWNAEAALRARLDTGCSVPVAVRQTLGDGRAQVKQQLDRVFSQTPSPVPMGVPAEGFRADRESNGPIALLEDFVVVTKDRGSNLEMPTLLMDHGLLHVWATTAFTSVLYRTVLARGRWAYEVTLTTEGLVQIGWCPPQDLQQWNPKLGVGDFMHSIGLDGSRDRVWRGQGREPVKGAAWMEGDVITCCADLDAGAASYFLNGRLVWTGVLQSLTHCRSDVEDDALPYYLVCAGVSCAAHERFTLNVGHAPFAFPQPGYQPLAMLPYLVEPPAATCALPPFLDAHVIAETAIAVTHVYEPAVALTDAGAVVARKRRSLGLAALFDEMPPSTLEKLGVALCATFLRPAAMDDGPVADTKMKATASDIVVALGAFMPATCTPDLFASVLNHLSFLARGITFPVPSRAEQNRYARAAMRLVAHLVHAHYSLMCASWPPSEPAQYDQAVAPFFRAKSPSRAVRDEIFPDAISLQSPLKDPRLKEVALTLGEDLYTEVLPHAVTLFTELYKNRPVAVTEFAVRVGERHEGNGSCGVMLWTVLARVILQQTATLSTEQVIDRWCDRRKLVSERGSTVEHRRLGGSVNSALRRCGVGHPRISPTDVPGDPLLIVVAWLFHYCARRQFPALINDLVTLRNLSQSVARGDGSNLEEATTKIEALVRVALVQRSRMANKIFTETLFGFNDLLFRIMDHYASKAMLTTLSEVDAGATSVPDMLHAGIVFKKLKPSEPMLDFMLLPQGFIATAAVILQLSRRAVPSAYLSWLESAPHAFRFSIIAALSPVVDQSENAVEGILHLTALLLESPSPDPVPHSKVVASTVTADYLAYFVAKCFQQMSNDFAWSMAVNTLSCLNSGNSLLQPRTVDPLSDSWLSWEEQGEPSEWVVPPTARSHAFNLYRDAVRLLNSADRVRMLKQSSSTEWRTDESCDLEKGFKIIVNRTSWLISELEVGAQDEVSGSSRGNAESRRRLAVIFELLQRNVSTLEFLIDSVGDQLVAEAEATDSSSVAVPLLVQTFVEMLMLLMRDYGRPESVMNKLVDLKIPELTQIHPWRIVGPLTGILVALLTPASRDGVSFEGWQLAFHKMLKSPRCSWDVMTLLKAVDALNIEELVEQRLASTVASKLARLRSQSWKPLLLQLADANALGSKRGASQTPPTRASPPQNFDSSPNEATPPENAHESNSDDDDEGLCPICCVDEVDVSFVPCGHRSCRACIERQLQGSQKFCFFCKAPVTSFAECTNAVGTPTYPMPARQPTLPRLGTPTTPHGPFLFPPTSDV